jgi:endonuclease/exonuclease/phosphatase family metal-dependent hydrolase
LNRISILSVAALAAACQQSVLRLQSGSPASRAAPKSTQVQQQRAGAEPVLRMATFNAGLAVGVLDYASERTPFVIQALAAEPLDVLCVQEFWLDSQWQKLVTSVGDRLPSRMRPAAHSNNTSACTPREIAPAAACVMKACGSVADSDVPACAMRECGRFATALSTSCIDCLSRDPLRAASEILAECAPKGAKAGAARPVQGTSNSEEHYYGGSTGIGLLTASKILETEILPLRSTQNARAVIYARIETPLTGELNVFCTHLTPYLRHTTYPGKGSWEQEQAEQVDAVLSFIDRKAGPHAPVVLLGDLNTGPGLSRAVQPRLPEHYQRFIDRGFLNAFAASRGAECTFCYSNPVGGASGSDGILIDHVLTRNLDVATQTRRFMDEPLELRVGGKRVQSAYSDHYGLVVELRRTSH